MGNYSKEFMVGCLIITSVVLMGLFAWLMGTLSPMGNSNFYNVGFDFAGGVEEGSPVRVAGVKVGKVEKIEFQPSSGVSALSLKISVSKIAVPSVREDSRFYVNMAGIIGERYIEVSPGSSDSKVLEDGAVIRGIDPPRIDQLLSQGYGVFGEVQELLEQNKEAVSDFLKQLPTLLKDATQFMKGKDWRKVVEMMNNINELTKDLRVVTGKFHNEETQIMLDKTYEIIDRVHKVDQQVLEDFLQKEGIRARIF